MQTIVKASSDAALLALMPHLLGMHPRNSVVLLGFRGNRTHGALRFDLPVSTGSRPSLVYKRVSKALVGMLGKLPGADGVLIAVVTDTPFGDSAIPPHLDFVAELTRAIARTRFGLRGVLCRASDGWAPYFDRDVPVGGFPLTDLVDSDVAAQLPITMPLVFDPAMMPGRVPDADDDTKNAVMSEYERAEELWAQGHPSYSQPSDRDVRLNFVYHVEWCLDLSDDDLLPICGQLLSVVQDPLLADLAMAQWASNAITGIRIHRDAFPEETDPAPQDPEHLEILAGRSRAPDPDRLTRAIALMYKVVACADDPLRPGPLCMLAWLHWALGRGTIASKFVVEAARIDPTHEVVIWLQWLLRDGELPDWVFDEDFSAGPGGVD